MPSRQNSDAAYTVCDENCRLFVLVRLSVRASGMGFFIEHSDDDRDQKMQVNVRIRGDIYQNVKVPAPELTNDRKFSDKPEIIESLAEIRLQTGAETALHIKTTKKQK
ncbi:hypothetical protein KIN20_025681 [Parelaphostrongylus tenuis]|uniref:Uncharacterized protein n=1 Tax=Parelaphostrongylus tenuis TaxID=148309 RepID=A0AAD5QX39_PARTN|nr:hypothetical protein KIN20_025681 [Parelaphostrongylus tenuis]